MSHHHPLNLHGLLTALALGLATAPGIAHAGIQVGLTPAIQNVTPGADFDVFVDITAAGSAFNGFDMIVSYNPAALTLLPLSPTSLQQGCLMTGGCSASCGNTFHLFSAAADSISISDVLLCNQISLTGPGHLYKLRFHASNTPQVTELTIRRTNFYNAGLFVTPVQKSGCMIGIGITLDVGGSGRLAGGGVSVEPNPCRGRVAFVPADASSGLAVIDVMDLQGRVIRHLGPAWLGGPAPLAWDGLDSRGQRAAAGIYLARIQRGTRLQHARIVLLP